MSSKATCLSVVVGILFGLALLPASADIKVSGFVDARYQFNHGKADLGNNVIEQGDQPSTFMVKDGALYLLSETKNSSAFVDLAFGQVNSANGGAATSLGFAAAKSQAFISHKYEVGIDWKLGRFDTPFGFEAIDTKDIMLATQGLVFSLLPVTHDGIFANYKVGQFAVGLMAGNSNQLGTHAQGRDIEMGFKASWSNDAYRAGLGYLANQRDKTVAGVEFNKETITDVLLGGTFDKFLVDLNYVAISPAAKNYTVPAASSNAISALLAQVSYEIDPTLWGIIRYEMVNNASVGTSTATLATPALGLVDDSVAVATITNPNGSTATQLTAGVKHKLDEALVAKAEMNLVNFKVNDQATSKAASYTTGAIAAVYNF